MGGSRRPGLDAEDDGGGPYSVCGRLWKTAPPVRLEPQNIRTSTCSGMLLRPRRLPQFSPPSPASPDAELRPSGDVQVTTSDAFAPTPGAMAEPGSPKAPVSPGSAQRTPWSARETELLLGTLLQPAMWRSLLLDRRQALPTYRRVSAALARQQVRRTPAQCRRRYKFLKDKLRDSHGQPSGPYDDQIRQLMGLLGDDGHQRVRRRLTGPGRPQRRGRSTLAVLTPAPTSVEPGATLPLAAGAADPASALRYSSSTTKSADAHRITSSPTSRALGTLTPEPGRAALGSSPPSTLEYDTEDPNEPPSLPQDRAPPQVASQSLNTALLQALTHLGDISSVLGPLRDQLATLNQHVEHLRGSFDQTVSLAVGFILGSAASERGILGDLRQ